MNPVMADNSAANMSCSRCTAAVMADDQFCAECGYRMASLPPANRDDVLASRVADICPRCSTPKQQGDDFCSRCGQRHAPILAPEAVSPQMMPIAVPEARLPHMSKPVPAISGASARPIPSAVKATDKHKIKPLVLVARGVFLLIAFVFVLRLANHVLVTRMRITQTYNTSQPSATVPTGTSAPAAAPSLPEPMSAEDQQTYYQYSAEGLSLGNYIWCRQTLLAAGASPASVPAYLLWLKHVADASSEKLSVVASAGCHIALADGNMGRTTQQIQTLSYYASHLPGSGIFAAADSAAQGRPNRNEVVTIRLWLDTELPSSSGGTVAYQETMDAIEAAGVTRVRNQQ